MLDVSANALWEEIQAAEKFRDAHLVMLESLQEKYAGSAYREGAKGDWVENHMYEYIRLTTGRIVFDNPKVRVKTRRPGSQSLIAQAMRHGLNRWVRDVRLRRRLKRTYVEHLFGFSVNTCVQQPQRWQDPRDASVSTWPQVYPIPPKRFFFDPFCLMFEHARYSGHKWVRDKEDLIREAEANPRGWNRDAIEALSEEQGIENMDDRDDRRTQGLRRKEVVGYDVWVPEIEMGDPGQGFHGAIYTIGVGYSGEGENDRAEFIREPRPYYGHRRGPYILHGAYPVPLDPWPLGPFQAMYQQMTDLNDTARAAGENMRRYKKLVICSAANPDLIKKLKDRGNAFVVPVKGFKREQVEQVELGGITTQQVEQLQLLLDRLDRNTGVNQPERGNITGATATEIAKADAASSESVGFVKQEFVDSVVDMLEHIGWFLYHDDRVKFPLGEEAAEELGMVEPWFEGGSHEEGLGGRFEDLELEIEPYSMERLNEALARAQYTELMGLVMEAAGVIPTTPFYDWKRLFEKGGEVLNDPTFSEFFDEEIASEVMGIQMAAMMEPHTEFNKQTGSPGGAGLRGSQPNGTQRPQSSIGQNRTRSFRQVHEVR